MKRFFRTFAGKGLLILICTLSLLAAAAGAFGTVFAVSAENGYVRLRTRDEAEEEWIIPELRRDARRCLQMYGNGNEELIDTRSLDYLITGFSGQVVYCSAETFFKSGYSFPFEVGYSKYDANSLWDGKNDHFVVLEGTDIDEVIKAYQVDRRYTYTVSVSVKNTDSAYRLLRKSIHAACSLGWWNIVIGMAGLILGIVSFISLMRVSARRADREEAVPGPFHKIPFDIVLAVSAAVIAGAGLFTCWILPIDDSAELDMIIGAVVIGILVFLGLSMSAAARIKTKTLIKNTLIFRIVKFLIAKPLVWLWKKLQKLHALNMSILRGLPLVWKTLLGFVILTAAEFIVFAALTREWGYGILSVIQFAILILPVLYFALCLRRLQKGGEALAAGDLSYQTETKGLPYDLKKHAENLNSIGGGMAAAVEERLKSERMKTELITNVSHDLKTPLTSLINYADLIGREPCDNPKIREYSEVLLRQSERLKRLIDDLVEASKASTGNLDVDLVPCDAAVFLTQAAGEYEERLQQAGLTLITKQPEKAVRIMADSRRMWRIFDNLMNNIVKYAMSGTRVWLSLEQKDGMAVISFRNTSREPLDGLDPGELAERFTRGDASRNTEGSGLGLAIAKSLAELQGGRMDLSVDGDLFKVILSFPTVS